MILSLDSHWRLEDLCSEADGHSQTLPAVELWGSGYCPRVGRAVSPHTCWVKTSFQVSLQQSLVVQDQLHTEGGVERCSTWRHEMWPQIWAWFWLKKQGAVTEAKLMHVVHRNCDTSKDKWMSSSGNKPFKYQSSPEWAWSVALCMSSWFFCSPVYILSTGIPLLFFLHPQVPKFSHLWKGKQKKARGGCRDDFQATAGTKC